MNADIRIYGARQNNLRNLDLAIRTGQITVITGVSGSGKSSLAFDTLYAEGQRRYVETFSAYARQFLDRMDKPQVDRIEGILPAIAIDQVNPVRNSRSTVGTMTELNDHLKLLYARAATLYCAGCGHAVHSDDSAGILAQLYARLGAAPPDQSADTRLVVTFPVPVPGNFSAEEIQGYLHQQAYVRSHCVQHDAASGQQVIYVVQDRFRLAGVERARALEALETALRQGRGRVSVFAQLATGEEQWRFSSGLHCAACDIGYASVQPSSFSFNSPLGACEHCRGFGRIIGIDIGLVIPDESLSLAAGAIRPWQTPSYQECQEELEKYGARAGIRLRLPWRELSAAEQSWVLDGDPAWRDGPGAWKNQWYGVRRFFNWLETRAYRMHVRVLLSKYRNYTPCPHCGGARLKPQATLWRLGAGTGPVAGRARFMPTQVRWSQSQLDALPGLALHDLMRLPLSDLRAWMAQLTQQITRQLAARDAAQERAMLEVLQEVNTRLRFLCDVGLGYLNLERQSRSLSGGEVQRINLTTALGTSLVNTLFVLDEPSIGLHPRDVHRIVEVMQRLRDNGNTLVVVEHDPQVMVAADRIIDVGPGPGAAGGQIVFDGSPQELARADTLTGRYFGGRMQIEALAPRPVQANTPRLLLQGVRAHNLRGIDFELPLQRLVCLSGVSGSGKSTLVQDVLYPALLKYQGKPTEAPGEYASLLGAEQIGEVILVDQSPIGKTARSNPASYVGAFDAIRKLFAATDGARERGFSAGTFSFNSGDGRCPGCGGSGFEHVEMQFLSDVYLRCPDCDGRRYRASVLEVRLEHLGRSASIAEVLEMTVSEALEFFRGLHKVQKALAPLADVGLDYVRLGQAVPTLSGGEAQRLKLAGHLAAAANTRAAAPGKGNLLLFDEPTTGLHFDDIARLMRALRRLLTAGHSLLVIEHNLDVIRAADWVVDLGPDGGDGGGLIVAQGSPDELMAQSARSHTGRALLEYAQALGRDGGALEADAGLDAAADDAQHRLHDAQARYFAPLHAQAAGGGHAGDHASAHGGAGQGANQGNCISIINAREHNLRGIDVQIPRDAFTVITGVSGSGKSTLAFDILFNEGQRRYLESLNAYARAIVQPAGKPDVDAIYGIAPTVAIEQRTSRGGQKSTVATMTEIHHFLRLLFVRLGMQMCPDCQVEVRPQTVAQIVDQLLREQSGRHIGLLAPLVSARKGYYTDLAKWAAARGYSHLRVDGEFVPVKPWPRLDRYKEHTIELPVGDLLVDSAHEAELRAALQAALALGNGSCAVLLGVSQAATGDLEARRASGLAANPARQTFSIKRACPRCAASFPEPDPRLFSYNSRHGWCPSCFGTGKQLAGFDAEQSGEEQGWLEDAGASGAPCAHCHGQRLNPVALAFRWQGRGIAELSALAVEAAESWFLRLRLQGRDAEVARDILAEIRARLAFMRQVGLGYLNLDRAAPTLSGGEAQRIRLAAQLGSNLQGVCYVLDEPTIGLHPRDNRMLLDTLRRLGKNGNTLVVVEHDEATIRAADHIIDMGPGAGVRGGLVVAQGSVAQISANPASLTGKYLRAPLAHPLRTQPPAPCTRADLVVREARLHNLRVAQALFKSGRLNIVTGVSGSGKSSLARGVLLANIAARVGAAAGAPPAWTGCAGIDGWQGMERVLEVDQTPIGKTPRSCPATYAGFWDEIRKLFAATNEARVQGWNAGRFSFNTGAGRCPVCEGQGMRTVEMSFLPNIKVPCDACHGARFNDATLAVKWQGLSIGEVLLMDVDQALAHFGAHPKIQRSLQLLKDVGLGYLSLGQPSPTLSGGEAQRLKLVSELARARLDQAAGGGKARHTRSPHTLYVLDEPTVGLSTADVEKLIQVLHRLVDADNTVVVIEHNLDIIAEADWILDLGPEGGSGGGQLVAQGTVAQMVASGSHTGQALAALPAQASDISRTWGEG